MTDAMPVDNTGVRPDEAALQLGAQLGRDALGGQRAESGRHAVVGFLVPGGGVDHLAAARNLGQRVSRDVYRRTVASDRHDVGHLERGDTHGNGCPGRR